MINKNQVRIKAVAYYLPQFHPTPENDKWWGEGFTEWTNVAQATAIFPGHEQPKIPGLLGYYDLRLKDTVQQQIALAQRYAVSGFCIYYYWFSGRRILEKPLDVFAGIDTDFEFCLCWANESWSRRWDGSEHEVLIKQEHDPEIDKKFIYDILPYLKKSNYMEYEGGKLLTIYRPSLLKDLTSVVTYWKEVANEHGIKLSVLGCETFGQKNFSNQGLDGSIEFPPHNTKTSPEVIDSIASSPRSPVIYSFKKYVEDQIVRPLKSYKCIPGLMTGWDNSPRRKKGANIFVKSSPELFGVLLQDAVKRAKFGKCQSGYVFINAWNEWAEGAYLEPDRKNGYKYLEVVRDVVNNHEISDLFAELEVEDDLLLSKQTLTALKAEVRYIQLQRDAYKRLAPVTDLSVDLGPVKNVPQSVQDLEVRRDAFAVVDSLNDSPLDLLGTLSVPGVVKLNGWFINQLENSTGSKRVVVFALVDKYSERRYVWFRSMRFHDRPDVMEAYPSINAAIAKESGYMTYLDMGSVNSGVYDLYIGSVVGSVVNFGLAVSNLVLQSNDA